MRRNHLMHLHALVCCSQEDCTDRFHLPLGAFFGRCATVVNFSFLWDLVQQVSACLPLMCAGSALWVGAVYAHAKVVA